MSGFPKLIPAFTAKLAIAPPISIGTLQAGAQNYIIVHPGDDSTVVSEPGYAHALDAVVEHGGDFIRGDADGKTLRLDVNSVVRDRKTGAALRFNYSGVLALGGPAGEVLAGKAGPGMSPFGEVFTRVSFETSEESLKPLERKVYVGSGRFIIEEGKPLAVEYKISEVAN